MKRSFYVYHLIGLVVGALLAFLGMKYFEKKDTGPDARVVERIVVDKHKADSLLREVAKKDTALRKSEAQSQSLKRRNILIKASLTDITAYADSLAVVAASLHSPECDSAISAKNGVIQRQNELIKGIELESQLYIAQIDILKDINRTDSVLIKQQSGTIDELSCAYNWKIRHKFWAWVFGWKCNKPPNQKK